jgi:hypothetical protein
MQFVSDTDFVPGSNWAEARVILNDKIECRHLSEWELEILVVFSVSRKFVLHRFDRRRAATSGRIS